MTMSNCDFDIEAFTKNEQAVANAAASISKQITKHTLYGITFKVMYATSGGIRFETDNVNIHDSFIGNIRFSCVTLSDPKHPDLCNFVVNVSTPRYNGFDVIRTIGYIGVNMKGEAIYFNINEC